MGTTPAIAGKACILSYLRFCGGSLPCDGATWDLHSLQPFAVTLPEGPPGRSRGTVGGVWDLGEGGRGGEHIIPYVLHLCL